MLLSGLCQAFVRLLPGFCQAFVRNLSRPCQAVIKIEQLFRLRCFLILFLLTYFPPWWTLLAWSLRTSFLGNLMWHFWQVIHAFYRSLSGFCQAFVRPLSGTCQELVRQSSKLSSFLDWDVFLILFLLTYFPPWWTLLAWSLRPSFLGNLMWHFWQVIHAFVRSLSGFCQAFARLLSGLCQELVKTLSGSHQNWAAF